MKVAIFGKKAGGIRKTLERKGVKIVTKNPDFVVSYGGDGTFLQSEEKYPSIPKVILKNSRICKLFQGKSNADVLDKFIKGKYKIKDLIKLQGIKGNKSITALNDIVVHNADPRHAIRYSLKINGKKIHDKEVIGDGVVVATPKLGATGYYRSITDSFFNVGIGLAFNNSTEAFDHMVLEEDTKIKLKITRGPARVYADNSEEFIELKEGEEVQIQKSSQKAQIVVV
jgi:NAD+ kinase